jgi:hypothetical protein
MADLVFVAVIIALFALCLGLVKACDRLLGPDELPAPDADRADRPTATAGTSR